MLQGACRKAELSNTENSILNGIAYYLFSTSSVREAADVQLEYRIMKVDEELYQFGASKNFANNALKFKKSHVLDPIFNYVLVNFDFGECDGEVSRYIYTREILTCPFDEEKM